jgi:hypothetical protein
MRRKSKGGRPSKPGKRTPSGQLSRAGKAKVVPPNDRVLARREAFKWFRAGTSPESHDAIGRAWIVGLLDDQGVPSDKLRDAGRAYTEDYWHEYPQTAPMSGNMEPERQGSGAKKPTPSSVIPPDPAGEWFKETDELLVRAGRDVRLALHEATVDGYWLPDDTTGWLNRLITARRVAMRAELVKAGRLPATFPPISGALPVPGDETKLKLLIRGLRVLVTGTVAPPAAPAPAAAALPAPAPPLPAIDPAFLTEEGRMHEAADIAAIIRERHAAASQPGEQA